nr:hypothetical protein [uncultured Roseibium sp.]
MWALVWAEVWTVGWAVVCVGAGLSGTGSGEATAGRPAATDCAGKRPDTGTDGTCGVCTVVGDVPPEACAGAVPAVPGVPGPDRGGGS